MQTCPRCGATIDPSALACPYCQTQTAYGKAHAEQQAAYQYHAAQAYDAQRAAERHARQQTLTKKAQHALFASLGATLTCCLPFAFVGLVMGLNVKKAARQEGMVAPASATAAVALGVFALASFAGVLALGLHVNQELDERVAELSAQLEPGRSSQTLDTATACGLIELELLQQGYAGKTGVSIAAFQCDGRLEQTGDQAQLQDVRFRTSSDDRHTVSGCLVRGSRWSVKELRADGSCAPRAESAAAPSAAPAPSR